MITTPYGTTNLDSLHDVLEEFDGFIVDQFGVLHDGQTPYPKAIHTLQLLINYGKTVVILSNSGKRSGINIRRMAQLGFTPSLYSEFVTSGDVAFAKVKSEYVEKGLRRCLLIARDADESAVDGLDVDIVNNVEQCDFIIISASEGDRYSEQHYIDMLELAAKRNVPCLCTNPDKLMLTHIGIRFGAGRIAELYQQMGGTVQWIGKPYPAIYDEARKQLLNISNDRILCIGDSIEHDIAGGSNAGFKTLFIRNGIHQNMSDSQIAKYLQRYQVVPDYQMQILQ